MAWFSGKVSLGNFPDLAGAVNKLQESVKNIEKNFDSALGFEEKSDKTDETDSSTEGLSNSSSWRSSTDTKAVLDPVMSFMGHKNKETDAESSGKPESSQDASAVDTKEGDETDRSAHATDGQTTAEMEKEVLETSKDDEHPEVEREDTSASDPTQVQSDSNVILPELPESIVQNVESSGSYDNLQKNQVSELTPCQNPESAEFNPENIEPELGGVDAIVVGESHNVVDSHEHTYEQERSGEEAMEVKSHAKAEVSSSSHNGDGDESPGSNSDDIEDTGSSHELLQSNGSTSDKTLEMVTDSVSRDTDTNSKPIEGNRELNDSEISKGQRSSSSTDLSDSAYDVLELKKVKMEMKMMETALQGAARQAQAKADEIAKMMNENEHLKVVIEDLKRKSNDAEIESLREEYHQRVATLERKIYALTKERDTLRREQNKKSDAAALLKEKDEIINQVMAEGEELSKKQAAKESHIRKLRAQIRELEEEKKGLTTKLQVEENKVESIKRDKTATEKLLQETIEKHQAELAAQKEFYTNALTAAKEAEALAESRANDEARNELESRLRESVERETMLVQTLEELRQTLSRKEQQAVFQEDMLRRDIEDLQKRYRASERRCEELVSQVPESTRPLLRQIEAMQETTARRAEAWAAVERSLNTRLQEAEAKAAAAEERERSVNERLSQTLSRINVLEAQISCLRAEQMQLSRSLEKERQRASENRQEYLAAKEEADTQEGRASQLEEEIKGLWRKHKKESQDALMHRELLQQEIEREKAARLELERTVRVQASTISEQAPISRQSSTFDNGSLPRKLSSAGSLGSMEESYFLQASLDSSDSHIERKNTGDAFMNPYYMRSMTPSAFEATLRQKEGELASYMSRLASMESIRDSLAEELVKMTAQCEKLRTEAGILPGVRAELEALRRRHAAALELMGERDEELEELRADIVDLKEMYREQVNLLVNKIQVISS